MRGTFFFFIKANKYLSKRTPPIKQSNNQTIYFCVETVGELFRWKGLWNVLSFRRFFFPIVNQIGTLRCLSANPDISVSQ